MFTLSVLSCLAIGLLHQAVGQTQGGACSTESFFLNFPHPSDCSRYYKCIENSYEEFVCPAGLVFNTSTIACYWPKAGGCQATTSDGDLLEIPSGICSIQPCATDRDYLLPNYNKPGNSDFYVCKSGSLYVGTCGVTAGTEGFPYFNVLRSSCERRRSADSLYV